MRDVVSLPSAIESMEEIRTRAKGKQLLVSLDYDGTLTPIVERPERAVLSGEMRRILSELAELCTVAIISGRDLSEVKSLVSLEKIYYAGSHGFDISGPGDCHVLQMGTAFLPILDSAEAALHERVDSIAGALIERKRFSIAVHYRNVKEGSVRTVEQAVDRALEDHQGLRKALGKKVFELQPRVDWHKGKALLWLLDCLDLNRDEVFPFFVGDDVTDEDVFEVIQDCGIGVVIRDDAAMERSLQSAARYALENQGKVGVFLRALIEMLKGREG